MIAILHRDIDFAVRSASAMKRSSTTTRWLSAGVRLKKSKP